MSRPEINKKPPRRNGAIYPKRNGGAIELSVPEHSLLGREGRGAHRS